SRGLNPAIALASWPSAAKSSITLPPGYLDSDYVRVAWFSPVQVVTQAGQDHTLSEHNHVQVIINYLNK
ncbi:MAG TPA: hypothetical protein VGN53_13955, partial [Klebsiella sp.]